MIDCPDRPKVVNSIFHGSYHRTACDLTRPPHYYRQKEPAGKPSSYQNLPPLFCKSGHVKALKAPPSRSICRMQIIAAVLSVEALNTPNSFSVSGMLADIGRMHVDASREACQSRCLPWIFSLLCSQSQESIHVLLR